MWGGGCVLTDQSCRRQCAPHTPAPVMWSCGAPSALLALLLATSCRAQFEQEEKPYRGQLVGSLNSYHHQVEQGDGCVDDPEHSSKFVSRVVSGNFNFKSVELTQ